MNAVKGTLGWAARQIILLALIMAALAFYQFAWPLIANGNAASTARTEWMSIADVRREVAQFQQAKVAALDADRDRLTKLTGKALADKLAERRAALADVRRRLDEPRGFFSGLRPRVILERGKLEIEAKAIEAQVATLNVAVDGERRRRAIQGITFPAQSAIGTLRKRCDTANAAVQRFNKRMYLEKWARNRAQNRRESLTNAASDTCRTHNSAVSARAVGIAKAKQANAAFLASQKDLGGRAAVARSAVRSHTVEITGATFKDILQRAVIVLVVIIAMPFLIRVIFFFVLAPLAERRAALRITVPGGSDIAIAPSPPSRVSIPVTIGLNEELLVRQGYLQTTSLAGRFGTQWFLNWRHPLSSIASGLTFLTRIRGDGETTTVSATKDPFAELTELILPAGSACVIHPRSLVAVVQPVGRTMRITSHWRLFSLNAWLTMQLRFMVFHGPGKTLLMGGRGIRVEPAERGRVFGQHQLVGFSADLSYSVARTETFWPYFFGREQLFKDKVREGSGILIVEEAPLSTRNGGMRRGLEGAFDATLKAFGI